MEGLIIKVVSNDYTVLAKNKTYICKPRGKFRNNNLTPLVGDYVIFDEVNCYLKEILPRKNSLIRPLISNIDLCFIITSTRYPDFDSHLLDKLLVLIEFNNIKPIIVFTKLDLLKDEELNEIEKVMNYYKKIGYEVYKNTEVDLIKKCFKGKISVFTGQSGAGKSTLLNSILGKRIAITSDKPQTTRNMIQGIYNDKNTQIVFVDTPGIHKPKSKLGRVLNKQAYFTINDVDIVIMVVDISEKIGTGDKFVIDVLKNIKDKPVFLVINKIDKLPREEILKKIDEYQKLYDFAEIIPVSARKNDNTDRLLEVIKKYLPDNIKYFDDNTVTSSSPEFIISEFVREKVLDLTNEEVPHAVTCIVEQIEEYDDIMNISATVIVDRENLKKIIIGKNGSMLKKIGTAARYEMEKFMGKKVYLETYVKVIENWKEEEKYLKEFGFENE